MNEQVVKDEAITQNDESYINLFDLIKFFLAKWYWFVFSIIICVAAAILYLMWSPDVYERNASVLIKDDKTSSSEKALFQDLSIFEGKSNVNNEMIVFKSYGLMYETVKRLNLDISYTVREQLHNKELYTNSPVTFSFTNMEESQWISLKAKLLPNDEIAIWDFESEGVDNEQVITVKLGDTLNTVVGKIVVAPTLWYDESWFYKPIAVNKFNRKNTIDKYRTELNVNLADKQASVVNLTIKDVSVQRAEDVLNTVIAIYNEEAINDKNVMAVNTENFINERLIIIEQELGNVDKMIQSYKTEHRLTDIQSDAQLALQENSASDIEINSLNNKLSMAQYVKKYLADPSKSTELIPSNTGVDDIDVESQIINYNQSLLKRNRLIESSSERNPVVQDLNNSLNAMRQNIMRAVDNLIVNLNIQLRSVRARTQRTQARISAVPQQQKEVTSISRQQQIKEQLYLYLLNKREENALNKAITESTARIIDSATGPSMPVAPRKMVILLAACLLGLAIPATIIYFIIQSDVSVRGRKDLTTVLSIPFLGEIPLKKYASKKKGVADSVVVRENGRDYLSEAFRIIRTNMEFMRVSNNDFKVITVTSAFVGSGKTFISANIAVSLAMTGKKVALIDMDLRKGTLGKNLDINNDKSKTEFGLSSYLSNNIKEENLLIVNDKLFPHIDIVRSGPVPPNPAELLLSPRLDELIDYLRKRYDYIVIDNVPIGIIADAMISNRVTDLTLFVIRAGKMDRRMLPDIEQMYKTEKLKNMAVILNGVDYTSGYGYGHYGYGYGSYGYGYVGDEYVDYK
ncbi:MAG: polysaccharide biosynthesis tyrosine autokinase [Tannerella sp.]|jgi:capsular exopolysaccharide synthesis family protein|nr:polysaccharide biosynthesis tyrosine autokinase [Tannerella sp.]